MTAATKIFLCFELLAKLVFVKIQINRNRTYISPPPKLDHFFIPWSTAISDISMPHKTLGSSASFSLGCPGVCNMSLVLLRIGPPESNPLLSSRS